MHPVKSRYKGVKYGKAPEAELPSYPLRGTTEGPSRALTLHASPLKKPWGRQQAAISVSAQRGCEGILHPFFCYYDSSECRKHCDHGHLSVSIGPLLFRTTPPAPPTPHLRHINRCRLPKWPPRLKGQVQLVPDWAQQTPLVQLHRKWTFFFKPVISWSGQLTGEWVTFARWI